MQKNVIEYLWKTVERVPDKVAIDDNKEQVTFAQLQQSAIKVAACIRELGLRKCPVGIYVPKSAKMVQAFAGVSLSCNFYVPLDTKSPDARILSILQVLGAKVVITTAALKAKAENLGDYKVLVMEEMLEKEAQEINLKEYIGNQTDLDPVYSIFTSGSTGTPKGVVISHRAAIDFIDWMIDRFGIDGNRIMGNQVPFYFDVSVSDIYLMYATGSTLVIIPEMFFSFPTDLIDFINEKKINFVFWVPFVLINAANVDIFSEKLPQYLEDVFFAGEVMPNRHLNYWRKFLPNCRYVNLYGPTEITVISTYYEVDREFADDESLPIGYACNNCDNLILVDDKEGKREAELNEKGELAIAGTCLALGYYGDWEKTNKAFIQNPLNDKYREYIYLTGDVCYKNERGEIIYCGRKDSQIKHNGYRIELGEIENAVLASKIVDNCCVIYDHSNKKIILFYEAKDEIKLLDFRKAISSHVPKYMLPSDYLWEQSLKRNQNGKIDRAYYNKQINK